MLQPLESAQRVLQRANELAQFSSSLPELTRVYLSKEHQQTNATVALWMQNIGMKVWQDAVGNICGRYEGTTANAPAILLGSHLDTVKNAGKYDGMLGVLTAIEVVAYFHQHQIRLPFAIEIIGFADEEGTRFGITLLGSKAITGEWEKQWLDCKDQDSISVAQAMRNFGLDPQNIHLAERNTQDILAYLELHIEQGPCLEAQNQALGVVTAINGARRLNCTFTGEAGHAGTVPMGHRKDALTAAAEWILCIEELTQQNPHHLVATVGRIENYPNAVNVISGKVELSLDIRGAVDQHTDALLETLLLKAQQIAHKRGIEFTSHEFYRISATACDKTLQKRWQSAVEKVQKECVFLPSGAGHDAIAIAKKFPVSMLFVRCEKGISHNPAESITLQDTNIAIQAYIAMLLTWNTP